MQQLVEAFVLGNGAILTNVCVLPLYPGLVAYLAGGTGAPRAPRVTRWLGLWVLLGVLSLMLVVGAILYALSQSFGVVLPFLLPAIYLAVIVLGLLMLAGRNPFARFNSGQMRMVRNPFWGAYLYGWLLGPMTLPCAGPLVVSAFLLGAGSFTGLADGLAYFIAFGLGFGWPLVVLPLLAAPFQQRFTGWLTAHYGLFTRGAGALLVAIGLFGVVTEVLPNW
jgi:cytochrome c-type biogenesis protein